VLAGGKGWLMEDFEKFIVELGLQQDVIPLGYVEETELQWLYQNCFAFLYPSLYEGFGLASLGGDDPRRARDHLQQNIVAGGRRRRRIVGGPAPGRGNLPGHTQPGNRPCLPAMLGESSRKRAKQFSWARTAKEVLKAYQEGAPAAAIYCAGRQCST